MIRYIGRVLYALEPGTAGRVAWSTAVFPTLATLVGLAEDSLFRSFSGEQRRGLLEDQSAQTAVG
jgi:hypothetical protein